MRRASKITNCTCPRCRLSCKENEANLSKFWPYDYWEVSCVDCGEFKTRDLDGVKKEEAKQLSLI